MVLGDVTGERLDPPGQSAGPFDMLRKLPPVGLLAGPVSVARLGVPPSSVATVARHEARGTTIDDGGRMDKMLDLLAF